MKPNSQQVEELMSPTGPVFDFGKSVSQAETDLQKKVTLESPFVPFSVKNYAKNKGNHVESVKNYNSLSSRVMTGETDYLKSEH